MRLDIRAAMYRVALDTAVFTSTGVMAGREPILPNRDAMVDSPVYILVHLLGDGRVYVTALQQLDPCHK